jgi:putative nucleotidyltransferase with HDIG domain
MPDREDAYRILREFTKSESLVKHALGVEAAMRALARKHGGDPDVWGVTGLLHDFDYEAWPDPKDHTVVGGRILREHGFPEEIVRAIQSHSEQNGLGLARETPMEKALFATDELVGFITACAYVRPTRSIHDLPARSVMKKMKDRAFARAVNREDLVRAAAEYGVDLEEHTAFVIEAMKTVADEMGLQGTAAGGSPSPPESAGPGESR